MGSQRRNDQICRPNEKVTLALMIFTIRLQLLKLSPWWIERVIFLIKIQKIGFFSKIQKIGFFQFNQIVVIFNGS